MNKLVYCYVLNKVAYCSKWEIGLINVSMAITFSGHIEAVVFGIIVFDLLGDEMRSWFADLLCHLVVSFRLFDFQ